MVSYVVVEQRLRLFREGLSQLLDAEVDIEVVGTAASGGELAALCKQHAPTAVVMQADATEWDALRIAAGLARARPTMRLIGLTQTDPTAADVARTRRAGIYAVVPRSAGTAPILEAIRCRSGELRSVPPAVSPSGSAVDMALTGRETTVLTLVGAGCTSREISHRLEISHKTVENHKQRIFKKLGVQNQAHAVSVAMRRGMIRPEQVIG